MNLLDKDILKLRQGVTKYGAAPHKPILLLAVIEAFDKGEIFNNWIEPTGGLLLHFRNIWQQLVKTWHKPNFALPFFHLKNENGNFWALICKPGKKLPLNKSNSIKSYRALVDCVAGAKLSEELFNRLLDSTQRELLRQLILLTYFADSKDSFESTNVLITDRIQSEILYDPTENYARNVKRIVTEKSEPVEEELVLRSSIFRNVVKDIYNHQCAITGLKIDFSSTTSMVDACHIIPFADTYDDTITNGIALSPTIHRAFDRGMLAISDDYTILIHPNVRDHSPNNKLMSYQDTSIYLPKDEAFYPSTFRLQEHRKRFGF